MRVGLVTVGSLEERTGGNLYDRALVDRLRESGHHVGIVSLPGGSWGRCAAAGLRPARLLDLLEPSEGTFDLLLEDELAHPLLFRANRELGRRGREPIVSIVHHLRSSERHPATAAWLYRLVERRYLRTVDAFVFNSENTRRQVEKLLGCRTDGIVARPAGNRLGLGSGPRTADPGEALRLVFVGNLIRRKNLETVLRAMTLAEQPMTLSLVGDPRRDSGYAALLRRQVDELGLADRVRFLGPLGDEELGRVLSESDVLVAPSTWEGFGIVYLEAMAFGLPVVASRAGAGDEVVEHGVDGYLVDPDDAPGLGGLLDRLAGDRERLARMSRAARRSFAERPGWDETMATVELWLEEQVTARAHRGSDRRASGSRRSTARV